MISHCFKSFLFQRFTLCKPVHLIKPSKLSFPISSSSSFNFLASHGSPSFLSSSFYSTSTNSKKTNNNNNNSSTSTTSTASLNDELEGFSKSELTTFSTEDVTLKLSSTSFAPETIKLLMAPVKEEDIEVTPGID